MSDRAINVHLTSGSNESVSKHNRDTPPAYYAIIGRGVAAWYNHLTLLYSQWGQARIGKLPVLHVGFEEPWASRGDERMGQWPRMLNFFAGVTDDKSLELPDQLLQGDARDARTWLKSSEFAALLKRVEAHVKKKYGKTWETGPYRMTSREMASHIRSHHGARPLLGVCDGFVYTIEKRPDGGRRPAVDPVEVGLRQEVVGAPDIRWANPECLYRLPVYRRTRSQLTLEYFYAKKVDICTGVSAARKPKLASAQKDNIKDYCDIAFESRDTDPKEIRAADSRILDGNTYVGSENNPKETVAVIKSGAVAAQSVQSALSMPDLASPAAAVWWISNSQFSKQQDLHERLVASETVPGARNQLEIAGTTPRNQLGPSDPTFNLNPLLGMGSHRDQTEATQQICELDEHFGGQNNPIYHHVAENRVETLRHKLYNVSHHDLRNVEEMKDGRLKISLFLPNRRKETVEYRKNVTVKTSDLESGQGSLDQLAKNAGFVSGISRRGNWGTFKRDYERRHGQRDDLVRHRDGYLESIVVDKLVFSSGQDYTREGTPGRLVRLLTDPTLEFSREQWPCALIMEQNVRILGGAMTVPGLTIPGRADFNRAHGEHFTSLPAEAPAAAGGGINPALINIRRANRFTYRKLKLNSASVQELTGHNGLSVAAATAIVKKREKTMRGCTLEEYRAHLRDGFQAPPTQPAPQDFANDIERLVDAHFQF